MLTYIGVLQVCLLMTVIAASNAYHYPDTYSVTDDIDEDEDESSEEAPQNEDYSKYFSGSGSAVVPHSAAQPAADTPAGFVQPIDFSHLFTDGNFAAPNTFSGVIAPPTANNVFAIQTAPVIPSFIPGLIPGIASSATNYNHSSQIGFVHPNPNVELQALFDTARASTGPVYQKQPYFGQYTHPATIIGQPVSSYSMYLPHYENVKKSVSKDVQTGQRQAAQATHSPKQKTGPPRSVEPDEYYDSQDDESEEEDEVDEDDDDNDEDVAYTYEPSQQRAPSRQPSPSESRPGKSKYSKKQYTNNAKKSAFDNPYPYKKSESLVSKTYAKNHQRNKQKGSNKKGVVSPKPDYHYSSVFDYPETGLNVPIKESNLGKVRNQATNHRPVTAYKNKQNPLTSNQHNENKGFSHITYPNNKVTAIPTFPLSTAYSQPTKSVYAINKPANQITLHGGFVPSAPIPNTRAFPSSYRLPYTSPVSPIEAMASSILPVDRNIKADSSQIARNNKKCIKIEKQSDKNGERSDDQSTVCYKCHDIATGASYEQCSYDSQSKSKPFYDSEYEVIKAEKNVKKVSPRDRRSTHESPYEFSFSRDMNIGHVTLVRKVRQYTEYDDGYDTPYSTEESDNYRFGPEYFVDKDSPEETDATEEVTENVSEEECRRIKKDGVICMVCQKPTGGSYEQCSYSSDPKENSYAYGTSSSYSRGSKPSTKKRNRRFSSLNDNNANGQPRKKSDRRDNVKQKFKGVSSKKVEEEYDDPFEPTEDFSESISRIRQADKSGKLVGLDPYFYGTPDETFHPEETKNSDKVQDDEESDEEKASTLEQPKTYDDYFAKLFPELESESTETKITNKKDENDYENTDDYNEDEDEGETKQTKKKVAPGFQSRSDIPDYFDDTEQTKDLEMVLGEFKQKDRSSCKKVMRNKMTCYQCLDDEGMQHEECMFVAASEPKNKHLAYHEVKQFRLTPSKDAKLVNNIDDSLQNQHTIPNDGRIDNNNEATVKNDHLLVNRGRSVTKSDSNPGLINSDNDSHAAENLDTMSLYPKETKRFPLSTFTIQNQRFFSSTGLPNHDKELAASNTRTKQLALTDTLTASESKRSNTRSTPPKRDAEYEEESRTRNKNTKINQGTPEKPYNSIPTEPPQFDEREGPEGAYSEDTEPAFDTVLKITLPRYMLERSEHEAVFDEVLASG